MVVQMHSSCKAEQLCPVNLHAACLVSASPKRQYLSMLMPVDRASY